MKRYQWFGLRWAATTFVGVAIIGGVFGYLFAIGEGATLPFVVGFPGLAVALTFVGLNLFRYIEKYPTE